MLYNSNNYPQDNVRLKLSDKEIQFLEFASSDMTYKQIATRMGMSMKGIDKIRDRLFQNLDVKSRVGLTVKAVKNGIVSFEKPVFAAVAH
ncbi:MAG: hypothetical protein C4308_14410 [Chitinophagaceae bacterium]